MHTAGIREHMEVIGADGVHVGVVDRVEPGDRIENSRKTTRLPKARTTTSSTTGSSASMSTCISTRSSAR